MIRIRASGWVKWMVVALLSLTPMLSRAQTDPGPVDMSNREASRIWFNTWWPKTYGAPMGFTGDVANGVAGDTSQAYRDELLLRINMYRRMAGEQPLTTNATYNAADQAAAVLCSANDNVSHNPPTTWKNYNATAADACAQSLLAGIAGPAGVLGFIADQGDNNKAVGHRLILLQPSLQTIGIGNAPAIPGDTVVQGVLAIWGNDSSYGATNLRFSKPLFTWPAEGYVPQYLIPGRWCVSIPDRATTGELNLVNARVAVTRNGSPLPVTYSALSGGPALVFTLDGTTEGTTGFVNYFINGEALNGPPVQSGDVTFHVTISGIVVRATGALWGGTGTYEYDVVGYDPLVPKVIAGKGAHLVNISTRSFAGSDSSTQIAGFIINGSSPRKVLIRAGGPYLTQFGVDNVLADPVLKLFAGANQIAVNNDWSSDAAAVSAASTKVGALAFSNGSKDAAIVIALQPNTPYTAQVSANNGSTGNAIVEVYDADDATDSSLVNISTRSFVGEGTSIQIGGFILHGSGPQRVLIRAGGPYLAQYGITNVLADPVLKIFSGQTQIAQNNDWGENANEVSSATAQAGVTSFAIGSKDSAVVLTMDPDVAYTAQVSGSNGITGNALIEIFQLP